MLRELRVGNLALAEDLVIPLSQGLTMLTGETGAGKSLVAGSLSLLGGGKSNKNLVRQGEELAFVEGLFDLSDKPNECAQLASLGVRIGSDGVLVLRREVRKEGRGRVLINGLMSSMSLLEQIGPQLLAIQSQDQQRVLAKSTFAIDFLDRILGIAPELEKFGELLNIWRELEKEYASRTREMDFAREQLDIWQYQRDELAKAGLDEDEEAQIKERIALGRNAKSLIDGAAKSRMSLVDGQVNAQQLLASVCGTLESLADKSPRLAEILELLRDAEASVTEAASDLERFLDVVDLDPAGLDELEARESLYYELCRKYNCTTPELLELLADLKCKITRQENATSDIEELAAACGVALDKLAAQAVKIRQKRIDGAPTIAARAQALIRKLGLVELELWFEIVPALDTTSKVVVDGQVCRISSRGCDKVSLMVKTNPGEGAGQVSDTASGGEKSRIFLGLSVLDKPESGGPLLLFDEIDAGIGMDHAVGVAVLLEELAKGGQVLCITHLPTVAARGQHHLQACKAVEDGRTILDVQKLNSDQRVQELARLLGGKDDDITTSDSRVAYARQLLAESTS